MELKISFAQNGEDILLSRCFPKEAGFYVDVGASSPVHDSVTQFFYERGWKGINFEPIPERHAELLRTRPRDISVRAAVSDTPGIATIARTAGIGGLSTSTVPDNFATMYRANSWPISVEQVTLSEQLAAHNVEQIDFLKIDAEGAERAVLAGLDLIRWRPVVILVEATKPLSTEPTHEVWEHLVTNRGYEFVWFDGLNRYYVSSEREPELRAHFQIPLNAFDQYVSFAQMGHPLVVPSHPDHQFACHIACLLLKAFGIESDAYLEEVMCLDQAPDLIHLTVERTNVGLYYTTVLGRAPTPEEVEIAMGSPVPTGRELIRSLLASDEFRSRRARVSV
ncbi:FkbM family methyltransferase [Ensifer adhaerens]|uniref:FkbM family methyltransferase n=1 Tax=Ensifer adhaerens TaxID=106592 RepID=UPI003D06D588